MEITLQMFLEKLRKERVKMKIDYKIIGAEVEFTFDMSIGDTYRVCVIPESHYHWFTAWDTLWDNLDILVRDHDDLVKRGKALPSDFEEWPTEKKTRYLRNRDTQLQFEKTIRENFNDYRSKVKDLYKEENEND